MDFAMFEQPHARLYEITGSAKGRHYFCAVGAEDALSKYRKKTEAAKARLKGSNAFIEPPVFDSMRVLGSLVTEADE